MNGKAASLIVVVVGAVIACVMYARFNRIQPPDNDGTTQEVVTNTEDSDNADETTSTRNAVDVLTKEHNAKVFWKLQGFNWLRSQRTPFTIEIQRELDTTPDQPWLWAGDVDDIRLIDGIAKVVILYPHGIRFELSSTKEQIDELIQTADESQDSDDFEWRISLVFAAKLDKCTVDGTTSEVDFEASGEDNRSISGQMTQRPPRVLTGTLLDYRIVDEDTAWFWPESLNETGDDGY